MLCYAMLCYAMLCYAMLGIAAEWASIRGFATGAAESYARNTQYPAIQQAIRLIMRDRLKLRTALSNTRCMRHLHAIPSSENFRSWIRMLCYAMLCYAMGIGGFATGAAESYAPTASIDERIDRQRSNCTEESRTRRRASAAGSACYAVLCMLWLTPCYAMLCYARYG